MIARLLTVAILLTSSFAWANGRSSRGSSDPPARLRAPSFSAAIPSTLAEKFVHQIWGGRLNPGWVSELGQRNGSALVLVSAPGAESPLQIATVDVAKGTAQFSPWPTG